MRGGSTDEELLEVIGAAVGRKKRQHAGRSLVLFIHFIPYLVLMFDIIYNYSCYYMELRWFSWRMGMCADKL